MERKHGYYGEDTDLAEAIPAFEESPEDTIIRQEELKTITEDILRLPEKQKNLLFSKYILGKNDYEIAEIFGITSPSVRQYLTRARRAARKLIDKEMQMHAE